jgi:hypothetical protein
MKDGKPQFHYHQISIEDANRILAPDREISIHRPTPMNHTDDSMTKTIIINHSQTKELAPESEKGKGRDGRVDNAQALRACGPFRSAWVQIPFPAPTTGRDHHKRS